MRNERRLQKTDSRGKLEPFVICSMLKVKILENFLGMSYECEESDSDFFFLTRDAFLNPDVVMSCSTSLEILNILIFIP